MGEGWLGADCESCPFAKEGRPPHHPVAGVVPPVAVGLLVGEGPGAEEVEEGKPFMGVTGRQLDQELLDAGLARSKLAVVNAMGCRPPPVKTEGMMTKAVMCCRPAFMQQIASLPDTIPTLAMGKYAGAALIGTTKGVLGARGFIREGFRLPRPDPEAGSGAGADEEGEQLAEKPSGELPGGLIATWHPTFAFFRNPYEWGTFSADLRRFSRLIRNKLEPMPHRLILKPTKADIARIAKEPYVAVDIETAPDYPERPWTGKDPTRAQLKTISLGCETWALAFHWDSRRDLHLPTKLLLASPTILKVTQNGPYFDKRVMKRYGLEINPIMDTRDMRRCLVSTSKLSLAYLASIYTDYPPWKQNEETEEVDK